MPQIFGSSLARPWVLVKWNDGHGVAGQRPKTCIAYLSDDCGDHFLGGLVGHYREYLTKEKRHEPLAQWHFRFKRPRQFPRADIIYIFNLDKSRSSGPSTAAVRRAKRALPRYPQPQEKAA